MLERLVRALDGIEYYWYAGSASLIAFVAYLFTLAPTVMWYDMGEFATASYVLGIAHNTGYPLYILLGKLFTLIPVGDIAYRVNLMSAFFSALTVLVVFLLVHHVTGRKAAAFVSALVLAFTSTFWANATWAESYPLNSFFLTLICFLALKWQSTGKVQYIYLAALAAGLSLCNHRLTVLVIPGLVLYLVVYRSRLSARHWLRLAFFFLVGLSLYVYLPIRGAQQPPLDWARPGGAMTYLKMFLTGDTPASNWDFAFWSRLGMLYSFPANEFGVAGLVLGALGLESLWRSNRQAALLTGLTVVLCFFLVLVYMIHNVFNYFEPAYLMISVWIGIGLSRLFAVIARLKATAVKAVAPVAATAFLVVSLLYPASLFSRNLGLLDRHLDFNAYNFALANLERVLPDSTIVTDSWVAPPFWYLQVVEGIRRDVIVSPILSSPTTDVLSFVDDHVAKGRPVYIARGMRGDLGKVSRKYYLQPLMVGGMELMRQADLPPPEHKDVLTFRGVFYKLYSEPPGRTVESVPEAARVDFVFNDAMSLVGFSALPAGGGGGSVFLTSYYWKKTAEIADDLYASVLFTFADGTVVTRAGFPLWSQDHILGGPGNASGAWPAGAVVAEEYYILAPMEMEGAEYQVRVRLFRITARDESGEVLKLEALSEAMVVGSISVPRTKISR